MTSEHTGREGHSLEQLIAPVAAPARPVGGEDEAVRAADAPAQATGPTSPPATKSREDQLKSRLILALALTAAAALGLATWTEFGRRASNDQRDRALSTLADVRLQTATLTDDLTRRLGHADGVPDELLNTALTRAQAVLAQIPLAADSPVDQLQQRAATLTDLSATLLERGAAKPALPAARRAREIFALLSRRQPDHRPWLERLIGALHQEADVLLALGKLQQADQSGSRALALNAALLEAQPDDHQRRLALVSSWQQRGTLRLKDGQGDAAEVAFERARTLLAELPEHKPELRRREANLLRAQGEALLSLGDLEGARALLQHGIRVAEPLADRADDVQGLAYDLARLHQELGEVERQRGDGEAAVQHALESIAQLQRCHRAQPLRVRWLRELRLGHERLGDLYSEQQRPDQALAAYVETDRLARLLARGLDSIETWISASEAAHRHAAELFERSASREALAVVESMQTELSSASKRLAPKLTRSTKPKLDATRAETWNAIARYALFCNNPERAIEAAEQALTLRPDSTEFALNLAHALMLAGRSQEALDLYTGMSDHEGASALPPMDSTTVQADLKLMRERGIETPLYGQLMNSL